MRFSGKLFFAAVGTILIAMACDKDDDKNVTPTVQNLAGTYRVTEIRFTGSNANWVDSLKSCERDNLIKLNTDSTANFIDAGVVCDPPEEFTGEWLLTGDSLYYGDNAGKVKSFDGSKLVVDATVNYLGIQVGSTTTLVRQ